MTQWRDMQMRGFTTWCNMKLAERVLKIDTLTDLKDGVLLIALIEILSGKKIDGYVARPGDRKIVKINNVSLALQALTELGVGVSGISASAFVDGDVSCTLALVWAIIQFYQLDHSIFDGKVAGATYNSKLLSWLKQRVQSYDLQVENLKNASFKDGLCFCALVHSFHPDVLDYAKVDKSAPAENLELAFSLAERAMAIPRLLEPADFNETFVDESLIVVYLSSFVKYEQAPSKQSSVPSLPTTTTTTAQPEPAPSPKSHGVASTNHASHVKPTPNSSTTTTSDSGQGPETSPLFRRSIMPVEDPLGTIPKYFFERVAISNDEDVLFFKRDAQWKRKNWEQLGTAVQRAARALISLGVQVGEKVCTFGKTRFEWTVMYLGALSIGAIPTSLGSSSSTKQEITHILNHSESVVLLLEKQSQLKKVKAFAKSLQHVRHIITREKDAGRKGLSWHQFIKRGDGPDAATLNAEMRKRMNALTADTPAALVYSPGTEGENPEDRKAVVYTHHNLLWTARQACRQLGITGDDSYVSFLSIGHVVEQLMTVVMPIIAGIQVYYSRDITCLADTLKEAQPSVLVAPPEYWFSCYLALKAMLPPSGVEGMSEILIDQVRKSVGCGRVRVAVVGGNSQPCPLDVYSFFATLGITLVQCYGQLETTGVATLNPQDPIKARFDTIGKPIEGTELSIAADGEILIRGPNVFKGYYKAEELTAKVLADGWYHTGDVGKLDDEGYLSFEGRKSDAIKLADGQAILPLKLETELRAAPLTKYAIAVGEGREHVGVLLILDSGVVKRLAKRKACSPKRLLGSTEILHQIKQHVETVSKTHNVKVRRFSIVPKSLSVKKGELSYTMSLRRQTIYNHFATDIDNLYTKDGTKAGGVAMINNEAFKKDDPKTAPKKITDGCFYRKTPSGEFKKTELKQSEVEEMERQLVLAMKEIRELAKRIKTLQEQHVEDTGVIEAKENAANLLASQLNEPSEAGKKTKNQGEKKKKTKGKRNH